MFHISSESDNPSDVADPQVGALSPISSQHRLRQCSDRSTEHRLSSQTSSRGADKSQHRETSISMREVVEQRTRKPHVGLASSLLNSLAWYCFLQTFG